MLGGGRGEATAMAMRLVVAVAEAVGARSLLPVESAHVDGCLYHGRAGLDFAERLAALGARVAVPTTLNVSSLDLLHPELYRGDTETRAAAGRQMDAYVGMGCRPTWTCAPYQLPRRPGFGEHVAWAESNAVVFANSVLGARTERYGDFLDICAAITGRVPRAGLHLDESRRGQMVFELSGIPTELLHSDVLYPVLGHLVGRETGSAVPVIVGLEGKAVVAGRMEDRLKALGAAAASSGSVALVHVVGVTPEAPTLEAALGGGDPARVLAVTPDRLAEARDDLTTARGRGPIDAVSVGTPHFSAREFEDLLALIDEAGPPTVPFYANTSRNTLDELAGRGWLEQLEASSVVVVTDTCTYVTPILDPALRVVMTNSAKWAYYAPGNIGVEVVFGSLAECVRSAARGRVVRDESLWGGHA
jgi:predicted aconitase